MNRSKVVAITALALSSSLLGACAEVSESGDAVQQSEDAIIRGTALSDAQARASGVVLLETDELDGVVSCSGTLIGPEWVITAAHCFEAIGDSMDHDGEMDEPGKTVVRLGNRSDSTAQTRRASRVVRHPDSIWQTSYNVDVALVQLETPFDISELPPELFHIGPNSAYRAPILTVQNGALNSTVFRSMGYGVNAATVFNGRLTNGSGAGTLRQSTVEGVDPWRIDYSTQSAQGTGNTCSGDSGGPVFLEDWAYTGVPATFKLRSRYLAGVHSTSNCDASPYRGGEIGGNAFYAWVQQTVGGYDTRLGTTCDTYDCKTVPAELPHFASYVGTYAPRSYDQDKCYYAVVNYDLENGWDFATVAGVELTGKGTFATHYCGGLPFSIATDPSVASNGLTFSASPYTFSKAVAADNTCSGTTGNWAACAGNGCSVCIGHTKGYSKYFVNHPKCTPNVGCGDYTTGHGTCNSNCPAPTEADR